MGIRADAIPVLTESSQTYSVRRNWGTGKREGRPTLWRTYELPWVDEPVETRQVPIPAGFVYHGGRNTTTSRKPMCGLRQETFAKPAAAGDPWEALD